MFWLDMLSLIFLSAVSSASFQRNFVSFNVRSFRGFVNDAYRGMNLDRYPVMPRKLLTSVFDSDLEHSFKAFYFFFLWLQALGIEFGDSEIFNSLEYLFWYLVMLCQIPCSNKNVVWFKQCRISQNIFCMASSNKSWDALAPSTNLLVL